MSVFGSAPAFQQTRHARRIYVGGIPPNYADEEALKTFLNSVISKGLGEQTDNSHVLSIYINQKKCFAFVELRSIELATACLDLDGIIFKKVVLKVLRANEYKPELIPPSMLGAPVKLDLSSFAFGSPTTVNKPADNPEFRDPTDPDYLLDSIIHFSSLDHIEHDSIVLVGFPFDDNPINKTTPEITGAVNPTTNQARMTASLPNPTPPSTLYTGVGCSFAPKTIRNMIRKYKYGAVNNPEFGLDLSTVRYFDVGDVLAGKTSEDTKFNLSATVTEIMGRGGIPFVVGGSKDVSLFSILGAMGLSGGSIGVVSVSARLSDSKLLDDMRFCGPKLEPEGSGNQATCNGRFIQFAAQGSQCSVEVADSITNRGGHIVWLSRDIRSKTTLIPTLPQHSPAFSSSCSGHDRTVDLFQQALRKASGQPPRDSPKVDEPPFSDSPNSGESVKPVNGSTVDTAAGTDGSFTPQGGASSSGRPVIVSLDMGVLCSSLVGAGHLCGSSNSAIGLTKDEILDIAMIAGSHPQVVSLNITEFNPAEPEEARSNMLLAELFYRFSVGVASRPESLQRSPVPRPVPVVSKPPPVVSHNTYSHQGGEVYGTYESPRNSHNSLHSMLGGENIIDLQGAMYQQQIQQRHYSNSSPRNLIPPSSINPVINKRSEDHGASGPRVTGDLTDSTPLEPSPMEQKTASRISSRESVLSHQSGGSTANNTATTQRNSFSPPTVPQNLPRGKPLVTGSLSSGMDHQGNKHSNNHSGSTMSEGSRGMINSIFSNSPTNLSRPYNQPSPPAPYLGSSGRGEMSSDSFALSEDFDRSSSLSQISAFLDGPSTSLSTINLSHLNSQHSRFGMSHHTNSSLFGMSAHSGMAQSPPGMGPSVVHPPPQQQQPVPGNPSGSLSGSHYSLRSSATHDLEGQRMSQGFESYYSTDSAKFSTSIAHSPKNPAHQHKGLQRTHSNMSTISASDIHPFDESIDLFEHPRRHTVNLHLGASPEPQSHSIRSPVGSGNRQSHSFTLGSASGKQSLNRMSHSFIHNQSTQNNQPSLDAALSQTMLDSQYNNGYYGQQQYQQHQQQYNQGQSGQGAQGYFNSGDYNRSGNYH